MIRVIHFFIFLVCCSLFVTSRLLTPTHPSQESRIIVYLLEFGGLIRKVCCQTPNYTSILVSPSGSRLYNTNDLLDLTLRVSVNSKYNNYQLNPWNRPRILLSVCLKSTVTPCGGQTANRGSLRLGLTYNVGDAEAELADGGARRQLLFLPQQQEARRRDI